jgi:DNA-binding transcriptional regulator YhcF (GntR family)
MVCSLTQTVRFMLRSLSNILRIQTCEIPTGIRLPSVRDFAAEAPSTQHDAARLHSWNGTGLLYTVRTSGRNITEDQEKIAEK